MKKLLVSALLVAFAAGSALAADAPEKVTLEAKNGNITFSHKDHSAKMECKTCHEGEPGKMELTKDTGHKLCLECHKTKGAGPTKCGDCHKK